MAAAAITLAENVAEIESDTTGAVITKFGLDSGGAQIGFYFMFGRLYNLGPADVFYAVSMNNQTAAATTDVVTTIPPAQVQKKGVLPAGGSIFWPKHMATFAHKTAAGTATLKWVPGDR